MPWRWCNLGENSIVRFSIDGQEIQVEEGTTVLEAAQKIGIKIPTFCYHEALTPYGACRLCCVEVTQDRRTEIKASCLLKAQEGMIIKTNTERIINGRKIMAELLLARCPNSEKIQEIARDLGVTDVRIARKFEDCALCGMCVRVCHERMGVGAIGFMNRGSERKIKPPFEEYSEVCQTCGACAFVCPTGAIKLEEITKNKPVPIPSDFEKGLIARPVIYIPYPQAVPNWPVIDSEHCIRFLKDKCGICQEFCEADAIDYEQKEEELDIEVGSIIVSPGYETFEPSIKSEYGYGRYQNVVTSLEFERILSASGPYEGHVVRLSDKKEPKKIAWIQCVGSRDKTCGNNYCSSVCCTYAIKEAVIAKEHVNTIEPTIFYMDMRTFGKGFEAYYNRAKDEHGVRFVRCRVSEVQEDPETNNLLIRYETEDGELKEEIFDMVVLSVGLAAKEGVKELADRLGIKLNEYGFCKTSELTPIDTSKPGIYVSGAFSGPKDIPETVMEASGAAARASGLISSERNSLVEKKEYPREIDVIAQGPRIGVFVCHCGINIGGYVDVPGVVEYARSLPNVAYAEDNLYTCSQDTQKRIIEMIKEYELNRVIVASCTPRTHEPLFQATIREAGLNPHLFEMANIRDQCSWVHMKEPVIATEKAKDLVRMAVAKARIREPLPEITIDVIQKGLVIGGGLAGMVSALAIAEQGYEVHLIENEDVLGGNLRNIYYTLKNEDIQGYLDSIIREVEENPLIKVYKNARIERIEGYVGNFKTTVDQSSTQIEIEHGIIIVATGAEESRPNEYLYGKDERVVTQLGLERQLAEGRGFNKRTIVMIQCVGSREDERPYCSRVCCSDAIKNALRLKEKSPDSEVFILYRDMRTYGFNEVFYEKAREKGVIFIRYEKDDKPQVKKGEEGLEVIAMDHILGEELLINADLVVLSPAIVPRKENEELAKQLKVPLNEDGFFLEAHVKLRPVDFATDGIFLAGMAHSPKSISESISQAYAAASRACTIISMDEYVTEGITASVNEGLCSGCGLCVSACPYSAIELKDGTAKVNAALCKGCGLCSATCRPGAIQQRGFNDHQLLSMIKSSMCEVF
ncbi:MAG: FAD-dependent oxidoreductase [Thermoplasmata archaeon]|nr:FAD-dependent oxidoreductase [Thermoplasmata archaeon]